jgi:hypothetical protein
MVHMAYELRPLTLAELLDRAFSLYRRHFWVFVGIMALPSLAMLLLSLGSNLVNGIGTLAPGLRPSPEAAITLFVSMIAVTLVAFLFYWITYALALGATTAAVSQIYAGHAPTISGAFGATKARLGRLAWLLVLLGARLMGVVFLVVFGTGAIIAVGGLVSPIVAGLVAIAGMLLGFGLFVWLFLRYAVSVPAAILEDNSASDAIARSIDLTRGSLLKVFVLFAFAAIVTYAALAIFQLPFAIAAFVVGITTPAGFWLNMLGVVTGSIGSALTSPLAVVAMATLYYDLRIRNEGLDLELMIAKLRDSAPAAAQSPSAALPG